MPTRRRRLAVLHPIVKQDEHGAQYGAPIIERVAWLLADAWRSIARAKMLGTSDEIDPHVIGQLQRPGVADPVQHEAGEAVGLRRPGGRGRRYRTTCDQWPSG